MAQGHIADIMSLLGDIIDFCRSVHESIVERRRRARAHASDLEAAEAANAAQELPTR